ncbi:hypothetical protein [Cupriavidus basilensis]
MKPQESIPVRVTRIEAVTPLVKRFTLRHADGEDLPAFSGAAISWSKCRARTACTATRIP